MKIQVDHLRHVRTHFSGISGIVFLFFICLLIGCEMTYQKRKKEREKCLNDNFKE